MTKILFVCHGNICRSPMAEFVMKDLVKKAGLEDRFQIASAATSTEEIGSPVYPPARRKLAEHGIDCAGKTARRLTRSDYAGYDLLIGMDRANIRNMGRICGGDPDGKIKLLLDCTDHPGDVADPWYTGDFDATWRDVRKGCQSLLELCAPDRAGPLPKGGCSRNVPIIEGCVDSYASALAACRGGADRLELCADLAVGGTTPSRALFKQVRRDCAVKINVLIRPRFGDFLYTEAELDEMREEIGAFRDLGADGAVIGVLTPEGELDERRMRRLIDSAGEMDVTLHRAFDMTRDPFAAMETAVRLGCRTILTSGQARNALEGAEVLRDLVLRAAGRIDIMAGCGVRKENIRAIHERTGVRAFHTTGRSVPLESGMIYRRPGVSMGLPSLSEYEIWQTDERGFGECARIVHALDSEG